MEDLDQGRVQAGAARAPARTTSARSAWTGTARSSGSPTRAEAYEQAIARLRDAGHLYECFCTRAEIRAASSAPARRAPRGRLSRHLPAAHRGPAARRSAPAAARPRCASAPRAPASPSPTGCTARRRASSTTSWCAATTARPPTTSPSSSTTPGRGSARSCAATTCWRPRRASASSPACSALEPPAHAHVPLVLGPDGARLAKRHGAVTLDDVDAGDRRGLDGAHARPAARAAPPRSCSTASIRDALPTGSHPIRRVLVPGSATRSAPSSTFTPSIGDNVELDRRPRPVRGGSAAGRPQRPVALAVGDREARRGDAARARAARPRRRDRPRRGGRSRAPGRARRAARRPRVTGAMRTSRRQATIARIPWTRVDGRAGAQRARRRRCARPACRGRGGGRRGRRAPRPGRAAHPSWPRGRARRGARRPPAAAARACPGAQRRAARATPAPASAQAITAAGTL